LLSLVLNLVLYVFLSLGAAFCLFLIYFFRDPERFPPQRDNVIVAPADGKIVYSRRIDNGRFLWSLKKGKKIPLREIAWTDDVKTRSGFIIGIFMSRWDVHVNRSPISGKIVKAVHKKGKFVPMTKEEFELENERNVIFLEHPSGFRSVVVQIASFTVRRISCYVKEGDHVSIGDRIGMVKFGSQVDLIIPDLHQLKILVKQGEKVRAGETIIAEYLG
jgi:phosphatidylserine decarboxylase